MAEKHHGKKTGVLKLSSTPEQMQKLSRLLHPFFGELSGAVSGYDQIDTIREHTHIQGCFSGAIHHFG